MSTPIERSGTVTILFTDIAGATEEMERVGDEEVVAMMTATNSRLREAAVAHRGTVVNTIGDSIMVVFDSALDGLASAVSMQRAVSQDERGHDAALRLRLRVGIHAGEPIRTDDDYLGMPVVIASRVARVAEGGQIVISDVARNLAGGRGGFVFRDLGERAFTQAGSPMRLWELVWDGASASRQGAPAERERTPATERAPDALVILFADIVDSMPHTERLGDAAFRDRARSLDRLLRDHVRQHRGTAVDGKLVGDGVLATFPSARDAIACALVCGELGATVDLELHLGIHAGDVIRDGNNIYGGAVNIASRIADATEAGEILVSETIRGLGRTSAGVVFVDRGEFSLKGVDEPQRLYTVQKN